MKSTYLRLFFVFFAAYFFLFSRLLVHAEVLESDWSPCSSLYFESAYLQKPDTLAGLLVPKLGICNARSSVSLYLMPRLGMDSRTFIDRSDAIYNDNYLFLAAGSDYTGLMPGLRLSLQVGRSFDLTDKIKLGDFDVRAGWMSWHEVEWVSKRLWNEFYSEGFYIRRYRNFAFNAQVRTFYDLLMLVRQDTLQFGPILNGSFAWDTHGYDYNRYAEAHYGLRMRYPSGFPLMLQVYGVEGRRLDGTRGERTYEDFRLVFSGSWEI
jgi:hypothetical protein